MFKTRLLSGILLVIIALATIIPGGNILFGTILIISLIGFFELLRVFNVQKTVLGVCGYLFAVLYFVLLYLKSELPADLPDPFLMLYMAYVIVLMAVLVFAYPVYRTEQVMAAFFGLFYVVMMLSFIYQVRILPGGVFHVWLVVICAWGCDTCAYCVGMLLGKHKLAPKLSPKKSVEGAFGGIAGAALLAALYALAINKWGNAQAEVLSFAVIGAVGGAISQIGDLAASAIKRNYDIKDYGKLIPGHGGILDRFDSMIITAPIIYFLTVILQ